MKETLGGGGAITRYYKSGYAGIRAQKNSFSPEQIRTLVGLRFAMRPAAVGDATDSPPFAIRLCFGVQLAQNAPGFARGFSRHKSGVQWCLRMVRWRG